MGERVFAETSRLSAFWTTQEPEEERQRRLARRRRRQRILYGFFEAWTYTAVFFFVALIVGMALSVVFVLFTDRAK